MKAPRLVLDWQLSRAIGHRRPQQYVTVAERRNDVQAQLLSQLLITEKIPAGVRDLSPDAQSGHLLGPYVVVVPAEYARQALELIARYDDI